jgi:hypothetical protein
MYRTVAETEVLCSAAKMRAWRQVSSVMETVIFRMMEVSSLLRTLCALEA